MTSQTWQRSALVAFIGLASVLNTANAQIAGFQIQPTPAPVITVIPTEAVKLGLWTPVPGLPCDLNTGFCYEYDLTTPGSRGFVELGDSFLLRAEVVDTTPNAVGFFRNPALGVGNIAINYTRGRDVVIAFQPLIAVNPVVASTEANFSGWQIHKAADPLPDTELASKTAGVFTAKPGQFYVGQIVQLHVAFISALSAQGNASYVSDVSPLTVEITIVPSSKGVQAPAPAPGYGLAPTHAPAAAAAAKASSSKLAPAPAPVSGAAAKTAPLRLRKLS